MKVNKCECSRDDDDRVIESKAGYEAGVKAAKESAYARGYQAGYNDVIQ